MKPIDELTYNIVKDLQEKRIADRKEPVNISLLEILRAINEQVKTSLNGFVENGTMTWFKNVNGIPMFKIQNPQK